MQTHQLPLFPRHGRHLLAVSLVATGALLAASQALAQMAPTPEPAKVAPAVPENVAAAFKRADTNADGKLSKEEAAAMPAVAAKFDEADKDKDGFLSLAEFAAAMA
jgi:hypothetical protein